MNNKVDKKLPSINTIEQCSDSVILSLTINADLKCFQGHFDDAAVTPGVVQLDWAIIFARQYLSMQGDVKNVSALKFQKLLLPDTEVKLEIIKKSPTKLVFNYSSTTDKYSSARVELA